MKQTSSPLPGAPDPGPPATSLGRGGGASEAGVPGRHFSPPGVVAKAPVRRGSEEVFSFGALRLEADGTLLRGETVIHLPPRELAAFRLLIANANQIVTPLQLRQALWGDVHVTADSVLKCLSSLRARLEPEVCIQTVYKRGYRFTAEVRHHAAETANALPRLAILPFVAGYTIPEYLGSAIAEEASVRLTGARPAAVSVLARDSVFTLASRGLTAHQVGETLKADLVLTGTLRALPSHFRLRAEMIRVEDGTQLWVEDVLVPQNRVAGLESELIERLLVRLSVGVPGDKGQQDTAFASTSGSDAPTLKGTPAPTSSLGRSADSLSIFTSAGSFGERSLLHVDEPKALAAGVEHREAYETFQRARHEWQTLQRHRMQDGLHDLLRATELDPSLIAAHIDLVNVCVTQAFYGYMSPAVAADQVRRTANSIPDLPQRASAILPALGWISFHVDHDLPSALQAFSLSADLPYDPWTTRVRVMFANGRHRFDEAINLLRAAIEVDPFSPWLQARLAWTLHLSGQAAESLHCIRHALDLFPGHEATHLYGSMILAFNGEAAQGTRLAEDLVRTLPHFDLATAVHAYALACEGRTDEARDILERLEWLSRERFVLRGFTPAVYVALGDMDAALSELHTSADARCPWFFQMLADPRLKPLHARPEFVELQAILTRMEADAAAHNLDRDH